MTDNHTWYCAVCQIPNPSYLELCRNCKTSREITPEKLQEKGDVAESRIIYVVQALFLVIGIAISRAGHFGLTAGLATVFLAWWFGLALFASQTFGGEFRRERRFVERLVGASRSENERQLITFCFRALYWPIFISKRVYTILIIGAVVIYLALDLIRS